MPSVIEIVKVTACLIVLILASACGKLEVKAAPEAEGTSRGFFGHVNNCHDDRKMAFAFFKPGFFSNSRGFALDVEAIRNLCLRSGGYPAIASVIFHSYLDDRVFDPAYYARVRPDVLRSMGWHRLLSHYLTYGLKPAGTRVPGPSECTPTAARFNECVYRSRNPEVFQIFKERIVEHYVRYGQYEGRPSH